MSTGIDRAIRDLPGVEAVTTDSLLLGTSAGPSFAGDAKGFENFIQIRGSTDGRYDAMDRPAISAGRLPTGAVGGVRRASRWRRPPGCTSVTQLPLAFGNARDDVDVLSTGTITLAGTATVRIVGIGTMPDEVLPDGLYPRGRILVSPDVIRRFSCPLVEVPAGASVEQIVDAVLPKGCARSFLYYSLQLRDGAAGVAAAEAAFVQRAAELNQDLPHEEGAPGYFLIATTTEQDRAQVARSVQPTTSALAVLGVAAAVLTLVLAGLAIARDLRRQRREIRQWWRLGLARAGRARVGGRCRSCWARPSASRSAFSARGCSRRSVPVGSVRSVVPSPGRTVPSLVWVTAAALVLLLGLIAVVLTVGAVRRPGLGRRRARRRWAAVRDCGAAPPDRRWARASAPPSAAGEPCSWWPARRSRPRCSSPAPPSPPA